MKTKRFVQSILKNIRLTHRSLNQCAMRASHEEAKRKGVGGQRTWPSARLSERLAVEAASRAMGLGRRAPRRASVED